MRQTNEPQDNALGGLGAPIRSDKPAPAPVPVSPGIVRNPDGTLATNAPPPPPTWVYTPPAAAPTAVPAPVVTDGQEADWEGLCARPCVIAYEFSNEESAALRQMATWIDAEMQRLCGIPAVTEIDLSDEYTQRLLGCI